MLRCFNYRPVFNRPAGNYTFKVNNRKTRTKCDICSKLTIKTQSVFHKPISQTYFTPPSSVFIVKFKNINADWVVYLHFADFKSKAGVTIRVSRI